MPTDREPGGTAGSTLKDSTTKAAAKTKAAPAKAAKAAKPVGHQGGRTVRATKAAKQGRIRDAAAMAAEADLDEGVVTRAIAEAEALHYDVEVNKRGLSVSALTKALNARWENGWSVAHILEQRGGHSCRLREAERLAHQRR